MATGNRVQGGMIDIHHHVLGGKHPKMKELPEWNMEIDARAMEELGIGGALLSLPVAANADVTRQINTMLHECAAFDTKRYGILCSLPLAEPERAVGEIAFACEELNADGFIVPSNIGGIYLGDERLGTAWLEELNRRKAAVLIHPTKPHVMSENLIVKDMSIFEFPFDTTRTVMNLVCSGLMGKFPNIKWIVSHAGGAIPFLAYRLSKIAEENHACALTAMEIMAAFKNLYYDIALSTSDEAFSALKTFIDPSHLLFGTDAPLRCTDGVSQSIDYLNETVIFTENEKNAIRFGTAKKFFPRFA